MATVVLFVAFCFVLFFRMPLRDRCLAWCMAPFERSFSSEVVVLDTLFSSSFHPIFDSRPFVVAGGGYVGGEVS